MSITYEVQQASAVSKRAHISFSSPPALGQPIVVFVRSSATSPGSSSNLAQGFQVLQSVKDTGNSDRLTTFIAYGDGFTNEFGFGNDNSGANRVIGYTVKGAPVFWNSNTIDQPVAMTSLSTPSVSTPAYDTISLSAFVFPATGGTFTDTAGYTQDTSLSIGNDTLLTNSTIMLGGGSGTAQDTGTITSAQAYLSAIVTLTTQPSIVPPTGNKAWFGAWHNPQNTTPTEAQIITQTAQLESELTAQTGSTKKLKIHTHYCAWSSLQNMSNLPSISDDLGKGRIPLISWNCGVSIASILNGSQDSVINGAASQIAALGQPVFIRWFWDFNLNANGLAGARGNAGTTFAIDSHQTYAQQLLSLASQFQQAWIYIRNIFLQNNATNVTWVWCPYADPTRVNDQIQFFYPNGWVDWIGLDCFDLTKAGFASSIAPYYIQMQEYFPNSPIMICETGEPTITTTGIQPQWMFGIDFVTYVLANDPVCVQTLIGQSPLINMTSSTIPTTYIPESQLPAPTSWNPIYIQHMGSYATLQADMAAPSGGPGYTGAIPPYIQYITYDNEENSVPHTPVNEVNDPPTYTVLFANAVHGMGKKFIQTAGGLTGQVWKTNLPFVIPPVGGKVQISLNGSGRGIIYWPVQVKDSAGRTIVGNITKLAASPTPTIQVTQIINASPGDTMLTNAQYNVYGYVPYPGGTTKEHKDLAATQYLWDGTCVQSQLSELIPLTFVNMITTAISSVQGANPSATVFTAGVGQNATDPVTGQVDVLSTTDKINAAIALIPPGVAVWLNFGAQIPFETVPNFALQAEVIKENTQVQTFSNLQAAFIDDITNNLENGAFPQIKAVCVVSDRTTQQYTIAYPSDGFDSLVELVATECFN